MKIIMKKLFMSFSIVFVSLIILFFIVIGCQNLPQYVKLIPWNSILIGLLILIVLGFLIDLAYVSYTIYGFKSGLIKYVLDRWGLFFKTIGQWLIKTEHIVLLLIIIGCILLVSTFTIGFIKTYDVVYTGFNKAVKYDSAISDLRSTYQNKIDELVNENTQLKIGIDKQNKVIQDNNDQIFLLNKLNEQLQVEVKRLLPKGAKNPNFLKP